MTLIPHAVSPRLGVREEVVEAWCHRLLEVSQPFPSFEECTDAIPTLDTLANVPPRTRVLVRCDTNVVFGPDGQLENEARLVSLLDSLRYGRERGWVQIIHGHTGTDGRDSLRPVAEHLGRLLGCPILFLEDWMDDCSGEVHVSAREAVCRQPPAAVVVLENARRYPLELSLWRPRPSSLAPLLGRLTRYANTVRQRLAGVHVNEGFAASNRDLSSTLVPLVMDRVALGRHVARELRGPVRAARQAEAVIFSGAKFNKLDDLEAVVRRGRVRLVLSGGLLAQPLLRAVAERAGRTVEAGRAEEVPAWSLDQSRRLLCEMTRRGVELVLPVDFVLEDGRLAETIPAGGAQRDVGPRTLDLFAARLRAFAAERPGAVVFHNGVLGQFERPPFAEGTRRFLAMLHDLHAAGLKVYVGGGEGGTALRRLGEPARVTHCFTAGTTLLKALGTDPIPYVKALYLAATRTPSSEPAHAI
jgi:phosphoglycerate kinase